MRMGYEANTMCKWDFDTLGLLYIILEMENQLLSVFFFFSQIRPALQLPVALFVYPVENSLHYQNPIIDH